MLHDQRDLKVIYLSNYNFRSVFCILRLMMNIILNMTDRFVGRNTSNHACLIFCSKSNCETVYRWFFLFEITVLKIMNNLNVCSAHSYLYPRSRFKVDPVYPLIVAVNAYLLVWFTIDSKLVWVGKRLLFNASHQFSTVVMTLSCAHILYSWTTC